MIQVKIIYEKFTNTKTRDDIFFYHLIEINGHANTGDNNDIRVCASVSAISQVCPTMLDRYFFTTEYSKGHLKVRWNKWKPSYISITDGYIKQQMYNLDTIVYQLYHLEQQYPSYIKLEMIEKEKVKYEF